MNTVVNDDNDQDDDAADEPAVVGEVLEGKYCIPGCEKILCCDNKAYAKKDQMFYGVECMKCEQDIDTNYLKNKMVYYCKFFACEDETLRCNYVECMSCKIEGDCGGKGKRVRRQRRQQVPV